jgi:hypothetical protein
MPGFIPGDRLTACGFTAPADPCGIERLVWSGKKKGKAPSWIGTRPAPAGCADLGSPGANDTKKRDFPRKTTAAPYFLQISLIAHCSECRLFLVIPWSPLAISSRALHPRKLISTPTAGRITLRPLPPESAVAMARIRRPLPAPVTSGSLPEPVPFFSAEDFDATCILVGFDPSASSYWWLPELLAAPVATPQVAVPQVGLVAATDAAPAPNDASVAHRRAADRGQAARRSRTSSTAAA